MYRFARLFHSVISGRFAGQRPSNSSSTAVPARRSALSFLSLADGLIRLDALLLRGLDAIIQAWGDSLAYALAYHAPILAEFAETVECPPQDRDPSPIGRGALRVVFTRSDGGRKRPSRRSPPRLFLVGAGPADRKPAQMSGSITRRYVPTRSRRKYRPTVLGFW
jgi:hypothetical protein